MTEDERERFDKKQRLLEKKRKPLLDEIDREVKQRNLDAAKCKKEWDDIDRWATRGAELDDNTDDYDMYCTDNWQPYEPCVEPFQRSKYLKYHGIPK